MHIIYRLKGSLTTKEVDAIKLKRNEIREQILKQLEAVPNEIFESEKRRLIEDGEKNFEIIYDSYLDNTQRGPFHLQDPALAKIVIDSWLWLSEKRGILVYTICVMGNHVHVLAQSRKDEEIAPGPIMKATKNFTALNCNKVLKLTGTSFWEENYFDRDVRKGKFTQVMLYILNNPVKAGLVDHWEDWPGTYLNAQYDLLFRKNNQS